MLIAEAGLIKGERIGVDASTMEANAALRNIVRRDNGEGYREMLERLARESGVETPTAEDVARLGRKRKGKKLSNTDWVSKSDPEAKIAKMKDGTTHLAYKPEHAVDLDTGAVVAAELHPADEGDTTTLSKTLAKAEANLPAHRRRHPAGGRGGRIWRYFRSAHAHRGHAGGTGDLAKRPDSFRRGIPHLGVRAGKSHLINGLVSLRTAIPARDRCC